MTTFIYPSLEWLEVGKTEYDKDDNLKEKLKGLSGYFSYRIKPEAEWGIKESLYMSMKMEAGNLLKLGHISKKEAERDADFIMGGTPQLWKELLTKKKKFVGSFLAGEIGLEKGSKVGALSIGQYSGFLIDALTKVDLIFPDDLSASELDEFKTRFQEYRLNSGV